MDVGVIRLRLTSKFSCSSAFALTTATNNTNSLYALKIQPFKNHNSLLLHPNPNFPKHILEPKPNHLTALPSTPLKFHFTHLSFSL